MQESGEMYLETILLLGKERESVRAIDIGARMGYSKPSVSRALSRLRAEGHILVDGAGHITLTDKGFAVAEKIYERHRILSDLLTQLGVDPDTATVDACRIEHVISDASFEMIKKHAREYGKK